MDNEQPITVYLSFAHIQIQMASNFASSSNSRTFDPTALPPRWLDCPRKSTIIADKFIAFKTPLDDRYKDKIHVASRWTCGMLIKAVQTDHKTLGLVIDLTNTDRFYRWDVEFKAKDVVYEKIRCRGHGETPGDEQIERFIKVCNEFFDNHPDQIIGVHCTHGFNRTGFLICAYLCREHDMSIDAAIDLFAKARPTGIYKQDYLNELINKYGDGSNIPIAAPPRPDWCLTNSDDEDEPNEQPVRGAGGGKRPRDNSAFSLPNKRNREEPSKPNPQFAVSLPGVTSVCVNPTMTNLQLQIQRMCEWNKQGFPGSQPVSMDVTNYMTIVQSPYRVSWKADGTRYMMLIQDKHQIYMFDRDNSVFEISHLEFPRDAEYTRHLTNTLVDGELVIDKVNGVDVPRYLIYDIVVYENENVGRLRFQERLEKIRRLVGVRNEAITRNLIDRRLDPFSVRTKDFWDLSAVPKLVGSKFREQIAHEVDGLIFQPEEDPYTPGRSPRVLKWKEDNTIDFRLRISVDNSKMGQLPEKRACLFVNHMSTPFAYMRYTPNLRQYDNKIIECSYRDNDWHFHRERTDKSFPNAKETAFGAVQAMRDPITTERLCSLIDQHLRQNRH